MNVLITRPLPEGAALCTALNKKQIHTTHFPTLSIRPINTTAINFAPNIFIFISPNAAKYGHHLIPKNYTGKIIAIGDSTKKHLQKNIPHQIILPNEIHSEGLLKLSELQHVEKNKIIIIKGKGGRTLIEKTLKERAATVTTIDVYERQRPNQEISSKLLEPISSVVITSEEALENLIAMTPKNLHSSLFNKKFILSSQRLANLAHQYNISHIELIKNALSETIINYFHH